MPGWQRAVGSLCGDPRAVVIPTADGRPGHAITEQDLPAAVGSDHSVAALRRREPVDAAVDAVGQQHRGERVEVVLVRQQEHGRDLLKPRAAAGGCREQLTGCQLESGLPDLFPLLLQTRPHQHLQARGPQRPPEVDDPTGAADQQRAGACRAADAQSPGHWRCGQPVHRYRRHDHHERDRQDLGCATDALGDQACRECRCGRGGDDPARGHPADERTLAFPEIRSEGGRERHEGSRHEDQRSGQDERRQQQMAQRLRGHGRRDGNEQDADNQLHERLEKRAASRKVIAWLVG